MRSAARQMDAFLLFIFFGDDVGGVLPDPISNSEVKPSRADGTARARAWESRTLPDYFRAPLVHTSGARSFWGVCASLAIHSLAPERTCTAQPCLSPDKGWCPTSVK